MSKTNPIIGTIFDGRYQIEALLGKGRVGVVYRARHTLLGDQVVIKLLHPEIQTRYLKEGATIQRLHHANAVALYDLYTTGDGLIYQVLEYVEGRSLEEERKSRGRL